MSQKNLLYILAPSFSGSTLLTFLLSKHSCIDTFGELKATAMGPIEDYYCSCGKLISDCEWWRDLTQNCEARGVPLDLSAFGTHFTSENHVHARILGAQVRGKLFESIRKLVINCWPPLKREYIRVQDKNETLIDLVLQGREDVWFLDGSKDPNRLLYLRDSGRYRIKVIKMVRDGRAQSHSHRRKLAGEIAFEAATADWKYTIEQMNRAADTFPATDVLELRYEELCNRPVEVMTALWQFIDIPPPDIDWDGEIAKGDSHILGNDNMRSAQFIKVRLDESWEDELSRDERQTFSRIAGRINQSLGYPD